MQTAVRGGKAIQTLRQLLIQPQYIPDHSSPIHHARWQPDNAKLEMSWTRCSPSSSRSPPRDKKRSPSAIIVIVLPTTTLCSSILGQDRLLAVGPKGNTTIGNEVERCNCADTYVDYMSLLALFRSGQNAWFSSRPDSSRIAWGGEKVELSFVGCQRESIEIPFNTRTGIYTTTGTLLNVSSPSIHPHNSS